MGSICSEEELSRLREALWQNPESVRAACDYLDAILDTVAPTDALGVVIAVAKKFPDDPYVRMRYAKALDLVGRPREALEEFEKIDTGYPERFVHYRKALCYRKLGDLDAAEIELGQALAINPWYRVAYATLIDIRIKRGDIEGARRGLALSKQFGCSGVAMLWAEARLLEAEGHIEEAVSVAKQLAKVAFNDRKAIRYVEDLLYKAGHLDEYFEFVELAFRANPMDKTRAHRLMAELRRRSRTLEAWKVGFRYARASGRFGIPANPKKSSI